MTYVPITSKNSASSQALSVERWKYSAVHEILYRELCGKNTLQELEKFAVWLRECTVYSILH